MEIDETFIDSHAPNVAAIKNAHAILLKGKLVGLFRSADGALLLGECRGSGAENYRPAADFADPSKPVFRCTCPSPQKERAEEPSAGDPHHIYPPRPGRRDFRTMYSPTREPLAWQARVGLTRMAGSKGRIEPPLDDVAAQAVQQGIAELIPPRSSVPVDCAEPVFREKDMGVDQAS